MKSDWQDMHFNFVLYKDTDLSILSAVDDVQVSAILLLGVVLHCCQKRKETMLRAESGTLEGTPSFLGVAKTKIADLPGK